MQTLIWETCVLIGRYKTSNQTMVNDDMLPPSRGKKPLTYTPTRDLSTKSFDPYHNLATKIFGKNLSMTIFHLCHRSLLWFWICLICSWLALFDIYPDITGIIAGSYLIPTLTYLLYLNLTLLTYQLQNFDVWFLLIWNYISLSCFMAMMNYSSRSGVGICIWMAFQYGTFSDGFPEKFRHLVNKRYYVFSIYIIALIVVVQFGWVPNIRTHPITIAYIEVYPADKFIASMGNILCFYLRNTVRAYMYPHHFIFLVLTGTFNRGPFNGIQHQHIHARTHASNDTSYSTTTHPSETHTDYSIRVIRFPCTDVIRAPMNTQVIPIT